ncbi:MAG TPA: SAM-dependent methyltransferase [Synergistaceae bacterium]|nr:SAM-dependent methyltransferase [Synergistaceae bacterium]
MRTEKEESGMEHCPVCEKSVERTETPMDCALCGKRASPGRVCAEGHFVCDDCARLRDTLLAHATREGADRRNPVAILAGLMDEPDIPMHDPVHHILAPAALLAAYHRSGGAVNLSRGMTEVVRRGRRVPGGTCGFWGACGAAIGAGIFMSVITGTSPYSDSTWGLCNLATARCLEVMGALGGPRCCKRTSFLTVHTTALFVEEHLGVTMSLPEAIRCGHSSRNGECIKERCPFFGD